MGFARKITALVIGILMLVGALIGVFSYQTAHRQVQESVGIEVVGCANITTGLVQPSDVEKLATGDTSDLAKVEEQLNWTVAHKSLFKEVFLLSLDGNILAADQHLKQRGYSAGQPFYFDQNDKNMIISMNHPVYSKVYTYDGTNLLTGYAPIYKDNDQNKEIVGLMAINFDASIIRDRTWEIITLPFIIGAIVFLVAAIALYFFLHWMIRPIEKLSAQVNQVAQGDLTVEPLSIQTKDEVGRLSRDFGNMTINLRQLITEVNEMSLQVSSSSQQLSASTEQSGKASEQTVQITQELADGAEKQLRNLEESSRSLYEMSQFINQIAQNAQNVSQAASTSSSASQQGSQSIKLTVEQMNTMEEKMLLLSNNVQELSSHSKEIQSILDIITGISAETHLLAINAAIEAAHAGEQGSGFAVVASSVRKLAERSTESARQIASLIDFTVDRMEQTSNTMDEAAREVAYGTGLVRSVGHSLTEIESSAQYTSKAINDLSDTVRLLSTNSELMVQSLSEIVEVANGTVDNAQSMSAASQEQLAGIQEVDASADFLAKMSDNLHDLIVRFKV
ncbi:methyl-accepting chemotaxis protein [Paenibacillus segetis]|uniref:Methyl-accepting chemotaxis protein n=1 Tax=Paenibacillus segetis TaxID=1325360 RepID=A0ABQ1Y571_9BACL|nr:methyl-accepting chemotaxis protein [Paenibacillus segetis]GGH12606.1 hypothetical protein GCM10008013_05130 [Paenibacillus segetis]